MKATQKDKDCAFSLQIGTIPPLQNISPPQKLQRLTAEQKKLLAKERARGVIFINHNRTLKKYTFRADTVSKYVVPDFVTAISPEAFCGTTKLKHLTIPDGVTRIGRGAFSGSGVQTVTLPSSLTVIQREAFFKCDKLKKVIMPDSVKSICHSAFAKCYSLERIEIPYGCLVDGNAFWDHAIKFKMVWRKKVEE